MRISDAKTTQAKLARKTGYSEQRISNWANGREPIPYDVIVLFAHILECHAEDFYKWTITEEA
nr:helix-turn-helix transcriptional regulator [Paenibacillus agilis]